jgi:hypothetical protein
MNSLSIQFLSSYWSGPEMAVNFTICLNLFGALILGLLVGYERSYHGRAAGMRTYGLVCMASTALTVIVGYPGFWYGGHVGLVSNPDPTRVIQGIVTGIGFLGAGVIMHEGLGDWGDDRRRLLRGGNHAVPTGGILHDLDHQFRKLAAVAPGRRGYAAISQGVCAA